MQKLRAVIFDMDGVIVNSEPLHERAFYEVVRELGYGNGRGIRVGDYIGRTDRELWIDFVARNSPSQSIDELLTLKRRRVLDLMKQVEPLFPGVRELLMKVAARLPVGLASGSERPFIEAVLDLKDLRRLFKVVVSAADVRSGKPAPDIFLLAAQRMGVAPEECWVVEDSKPGVASGRAAGMEVIAITNTYPAAELGTASHVVANYGEIERLLL